MKHIIAVLLVGCLSLFPLFADEGEPDFSQDQAAPDADPAPDDQDWFVDQGEHEPLTDEEALAAAQMAQMALQETIAEMEAMRDDLEEQLELAIIEAETAGQRADAADLRSDSLAAYIQVITDPLYPRMQESFRLIEATEAVKLGEDFRERGNYTEAILSYQVAIDLFSETLTEEQAKAAEEARLREEERLRIEALRQEAQARFEAAQRLNNQYNEYIKEEEAKLRAQGAPNASGAPSAPAPSTSTSASTSAQGTSASQGTGDTQAPYTGPPNAPTQGTSATQGTWATPRTGGVSP